MPKMSWPKIIFMGFFIAIFSALLTAGGVVYYIDKHTDVPEASTNISRLLSVQADIMENLNAEEKKQIARNMPIIIETVGEFLRKQAQKEERPVEEIVMNAMNFFMSIDWKKTLKGIQTHPKLPRFPPPIHHPNNGG